MKSISIPALTLLLVPLLLIPLVSPAQDNTSGTGHFEGVLSDPHYLAGTKTFNVKFGGRSVEATLTVSGNGVSWYRIQTNFPKQFLPWTDVAAWCTGPGQDLHLMSSRQGQPLQTIVDFRDFQPEDFSTVVNEFFKKYVPDAEQTNPDGSCFGRPTLN